MDYLGLNNLEELPSLNEMIVPENMIAPTDATEAIPENDQIQMVVNEEGTLIEVAASEIENKTESEADIELKNDINTEKEDKPEEE
jgi:hypothetical protein